MTNKELIEHYPWLEPSNVWSGKKITACAGPDGEEGYWPGAPEEHPEYDYEYTELDNMPDGWRAAFGEEMCEELNKEILTWDKLDQERFRIIQIKEKWGGLRFYTNYGSKKLYQIIGKYEEKSRHICINCGAPATQISRGWISPYCDKCAQEMSDHRVGEEFVSIGEYYERRN